MFLVIHFILVSLQYHLCRSTIQNLLKAHKFASFIESNSVSLNWFHFLDDRHFPLTANRSLWNTNTV